jgi:hypothetical protein
VTRSVVHKSQSQICFQIINYLFLAPLEKSGLFSVKDLEGGEKQWI